MAQKAAAFHHRRPASPLSEFEQMDDVPWIDVALSCGYFDQAHFNHDFHAFSGITPSTYRRQRVARSHVAEL